jgi:uncharacterized membrane protein HdeD (DUF308 family)
MPGGLGEEICAIAIKRRQEMIGNLFPVGGLTGLIAGILAIVAGIVILVWPKIIAYIIGIYLIVVGLVTVITVFR